MKHACVLTTINVPNVLQLYRACSPDVRFFVVGDKKSDDVATQILMDTIPNSEYYSYARQQELGYGANALLPENCIQRRNIGFLEAIKWGAEIVTSVDDDNLPLNATYFADFAGCFEWQSGQMPNIDRATGLFAPIGTPRLFDGIEISGKDGWFDVGQYLQPASPHRGFPIQRKHDPIYGTAVKAKVGVAAGICLGDPDISAVTRIANAPDVQQVSQLLESGCVVAHDTHTVFNSQNTTILRELLPAWGMIPFVGRYDDIYASVICKRIMHDRGLHVHFGKPFVIQQRNAHNLVGDLRGEVDGMDGVLKLAALLDAMTLPNKSVVSDCRLIWDAIRAAELIDYKGVSAMYAYLNDCEALGL